MICSCHVPPRDASVPARDRRGRAPKPVYHRVPPPAVDPIAQMTAAVALIDKLRGTPEKPKDAAAELENVLKIQRQMEEQFGTRANRID